MKQKQTEKEFAKTWTEENCDNIVIWHDVRWGSYGIIKGLATFFPTQSKITPTLPNCFRLSVQFLNEADVVRSFLITKEELSELKMIKSNAFTQVLF